MKLNIYSIFDSASGLYSRPFFTQSDAEAMRSFTDIATDADHPIGKHPEDYSLHRLGTFDDTKAKLTDEDNECLVTALETISSTRKVHQPAQLDLVEEIENDNRITPGVNTTQ